jgi:Uncharacterized conserved protein
MPVNGTMHDKKVSHDLERAFRDRARGVKRAGLWAAARLGMSGVDAEAYARSVVTADFEEAGDEDVIAKLRRDLAALGVADGEIRAQLAHCLAEAAAGDGAGN